MENGDLLGSPFCVLVLG